jgi:hypothetical protein
MGSSLQLRAVREPVGREGAFSPLLEWDRLCNHCQDALADTPHFAFSPLLEWDRLCNPALLSSDTSILGSFTSDQWLRSRSGQFTQPVYASFVILFQRTVANRLLHKNLAHLRRCLFNIELPIAEYSAFAHVNQRAYYQQHAKVRQRTGVVHYPYYTSHLDLLPLSS